MKLYSFLIALSVLALASCRGGDEPLPGVDEGGTDQTGAPVSNVFLALNIVTDGAQTRGDLQFQDGTQIENDVKSVRLYFFTANGTPAAVEPKRTPMNGNMASFRSYFDFVPKNQSATPDNNNVEKVLLTTIVKIDPGVENSDKIPSHVVAVLNPSGLPEENLTLDQLMDQLDAYNTAQLTNSGTFVMSNSVYVDNDGFHVSATDIGGHIHHTEAEALSDPLEVSVERVVARLDLAVVMNPLANHPGVYDTGVEYNINDIAGESPAYKGNIYVKFLGWNVTATPAKSRLLKKIDPTWKDNLFGANSDAWNNPLRNRSHWALNPESPTFNYGDFGQALPNGMNPEGLTYTPDGLPANALKFGAGNAKVSTYLQENAAKFNNNGFAEPFDHSKVIIAAQLVQSDGVTPIQLAEWDFEYFTINGMKTILAQSAGLYKMTTANGKTTYKEIEPSDITFVSAGSLDPGIMNSSSKGRFYVYPKLKEGNTKWAASNAEGSPEIGYAAANATLQALGPVKIWSGGYTYYYFDIRHLGALNFPGYFGVVRNHIYNAEIKSVASLGTPVYDPDEIIYPEKPDDTYSLLAAEIKVLLWRIVRKEIKLQW